MNYHSFARFFNLVGQLPWSNNGQSVTWIIELGAVAFIIWLLDGGGFRREAKVKDDDLLKKILKKLAD